MQARPQGASKSATRVFRTKMGWVAVAASPNGIVKVAGPHKSKSKALRQIPNWEGEGTAAVRDLLDRAQQQLKAYYAGERVTFDLPLDLHAQTPFQRKVLREAARIPYGRTITYGELAARVGKPRAARAVGQVMKRNPVAPIVPCHRVIGAGGSLVGFTGGLHLKARLLQMESAARNRA